MMAGTGWSAALAADFCSRWLPAWTGNDPERLLDFYSDDVFYSDPAVPAGLNGREALGQYFGRLLAAYPQWVWTHERSLPVPDGFLNYWRAQLSPLPDDLSWCGVCIVQVRDERIYRNEVYFDRSILLRGRS